MTPNEHNFPAQPFASQLSISIPPENVRKAEVFFMSSGSVERSFLCLCLSMCDPLLKTRH